MNWREKIWESLAQVVDQNEENKQDVPGFCVDRRLTHHRVALMFFLN